MKKIPALLGGVSIALATVLWLGFSSFPLQDGYRLQGFFGHGAIYRGFLHKVIDAEVVGVQGCYKGIIFGWVSGRVKPYFILNTSSRDVEWNEAQEQYRRLKSLACPAPDMNKEVNIASLRSGFGEFSRN